jgi:cholera toxin transcriptional activator
LYFQVHLKSWQVFDTLDLPMTDSKKARRYRFGVFEADAATGELRKQGIRIKVNAQPFQVLLMLLERPGEVLTREEISRELWPDGTFVDYEHGVNSAVNRIREALGDKANNPKFIETLARRGYRFVALVQPIALNEDLSLMDSKPTAQETQSPVSDRSESEYRIRFLSSASELPKTSYQAVQTFFVLLQVMYLGFYVGALANLAEIEDLLSVLPKPTETLVVLVVTAALLIPVRVFLTCAVLLQAPGVRGKVLRIWPFLLPFDILWSLSPFLLLHHISAGLALAFMAPLVYSPFAQRSLILMGAGAPNHAITAHGS